MSKDTEKNVEEKIGSMCVILHRERSFHNVDIRTLKSAVQKYARRGMFIPKGVWCLIELDLFSYLEIKPDLYKSDRLTQKQIQQNSVRIRSNMINRLIAMMSEDVGPCNSQLPSKIHKLYLQWIKHRREISTRKIIIEMYYCLANENIKRIRLLSDLKTVYNLPEYSISSDKLHRELLEKFQMKELIKIMYDDDGCRKKTKQELYELIIEHLSMKSELAFAYLSILFKRNDQTFINRQLWTYLIRTSPFSDSTQALAFFYKALKHKEHYLYLYHAMAFVIYEDIIRKIDQSASDLLDIDIDALYKDHINAETKLELDSYVFDRHTGVSTSRSDFALEGAQVSNECKELFIDKYRRMYIEFKVMMDDDEKQRKQKKEVKSTTRKRKGEVLQAENETKKKSKTNIDEHIRDDDLDIEIIRLDYQLDIKPAAFVSDNLSKLAHGQPRTSARKKAVFISSDYIYKGPYVSNLQGDKRRLLYNLYFTRALLLLEQYLKIPEQLRSIVDWHSIVKIDNTDEYYLKQISLGKLPVSENEKETITTKIEANVKILRRGSHINRLIELEKDESNFQDAKKQVCRACLQHFYLRYLLNIGDSGTWNILVRRDDHNQGICGIDFEEIRSEKEKKIDDALTLIMSKVSKRQRSIYGPFINDIIIFKNKIDCSDELAKKLSTSFKIDIEKMNERIEKYTNCIVKN